MTTHCVCVCRRQCVHLTALNIEQDFLHWKITESPDVRTHIFSQNCSLSSCLTVDISIHLWESFFFFFSLKWPNIIILLLLLLMIIIIIICTKLLKMMMWNITTVTSPVLVLLLVRISWSLSWSLSARFLSRCSCRFRSFSWDRHPHQSITVHSFGDFKLFSNRLLKMSTLFSFVSRRTHGCTALLFQNPLSVQRVFDFLQDAQWLLVWGEAWLTDWTKGRASLSHLPDYYLFEFDDDFTVLVSLPLLPR